MTARPMTSVRTNMDATEWAARQQLAACYRIVAMLGWDELIFNHISYRLPGDEPTFLINPFGLRYDEVTASNLVKLDLEGNIISPSEHIVNLGGFHFHSQVHRAVEDAHCVLHTHTTAGVAVSALEHGLPSTNSYSMLLVGNLAYHDLAETPVSDEEGPRLASALQNAHSIILRNHGLLTVGRTIPAAFYRMWNLNRACEIHIAAAAAGELRLVSDKASRAFGDVAKIMKSPDGKRMMSEVIGENEFKALTRKIDKIDTSWRD